MTNHFFSLFSVDNKFFKIGMEEWSSLSTFISQNYGVFWLLLILTVTIVLYLDEFKKYLPKISTKKYVQVNPEDNRILKARELQQELTQQALREAVAEKRRIKLEEDEKRKLLQANKQPFVPYKKSGQIEKEEPKKKTLETNKFPQLNSNNNGGFFNFTNEGDLPRYKPSGFNRRRG